MNQPQKNQGDLSLSADGLASDLGTCSGTHVFYKLTPENDRAHSDTALGQLNILLSL